MLVSKVIHENKNYVVTLQTNTEGKLEYALVNKVTGVTEGTMLSLPYAIGEAEQSNAYLEFQMWEWITAQNKRARSEMDKAFVEEAFDDTVVN